MAIYVPQSKFTEDTITMTHHLAATPPEMGGGQ
jgi:hypothetical protein